jgi:hypothetical protein
LSVQDPLYSASLQRTLQEIGKTIGLLKRLFGNISILNRFSRYSSKLLDRDTQNAAFAYPLPSPHEVLIKPRAGAGNSEIEAFESVKCHVTLESQWGHLRDIVIPGWHNRRAR